MYFVLSTGRAGSRTIAAALDAHPGTVCRHHPRPELAAEATAFHCGDLSREPLEKVLRETRHPVVDGKIYGEVALQHTLLFPILRDLFPEARYVWLMRDGRDAVASMYYRGWYDERYPRQGVEWRSARLHGDRTGDFSPETWAQMSPFERCCWCWKKFNHVIEQDLATLPSSESMLVRLDRLGSTMPALLGFLGLDPKLDARITQLNTARQPVNYWSKWTPQQRSVFEGLCADDMDRWFPEWRSPRGVWRRLAAEPVERAPRRSWLGASARPGSGPIRRRLARFAALAGG